MGEWEWAVYLIARALVREAPPVNPGGVLRLTSCYAMRYGLNPITRSQRPMYKSYSRFFNRYHSKATKYRNGPKRFGLYGKARATLNAATTERLKAARLSKGVK